MSWNCFIQTKRIVIFCINNFELYGAIKWLVAGLIWKFENFFPELFQITIGCPFLMDMFTLAVESEMSAQTVADPLRVLNIYLRLLI